MDRVMDLEKLAREELSKGNWCMDDAIQAAVRVGRAVAEEIALKCQTAANEATHNLQDFAAEMTSIACATVEHRGGQRSLVPPVAGSSPAPSATRPGGAPSTSGAAPPALYLEGYAEAVIRATLDRARRAYSAVMDDVADRREAWNHAQRAIEQVGEYKRQRAEAAHAAQGDPASNPDLEKTKQEPPPASARAAMIERAREWLKEGDRALRLSYIPPSTIADFALSEEAKRG